MKNEIKNLALRLASQGHEILLFNYTDEIIFQEMLKKIF